MSYRDHLAMLESHNRKLEATVAKNTEDLKKLANLVNHLDKRIESLANQLRMVPYSGNAGGGGNSYGSGTTGASYGSGGSSTSGSPRLSVDQRPPAPLPGESLLGMRPHPLIQTLERVTRLEIIIQIILLDIVMIRYLLVDIDP